MFRVRYGRKNRLGSVAQSTEYKSVYYDSKREAQEAADLDYRLMAHDIKAVDRQVTMPLDVNGHHICNYRIDFVVTHNDGTLEYIEVKGFETEVWRMKWKIFEAIYGGLPGVRLTVVR